MEGRKEGRKKGRTEGKKNLLTNLHSQNKPNRYLGQWTYQWV